MAPYRAESDSREGTPLNQISREMEMNKGTVAYCFAAVLAPAVAALIALHGPDPHGAMGQVRSDLPSAERVAGASGALSGNAVAMAWALNSYR